jgi:hypothetical protein
MQPLNSRYPSKSFNPAWACWKHHWLSKYCVLRTFRGHLMQRIDILWRDIPSQVLIKRGRDRGKYMLSARFQEAIDRAAMRAGKGGSDAYLEEWRRVTTTIEAEGALEEIAEQLGREIETGFSDEQLAVMVKQKGFAEISP